ncbi:YmfQ family protein [Escherichia coli]|nr:YmfQ family protein [Escherichia coli]EFI3659076.1 YmfQ family protein [Escherichia coli]EJD3144248.1 YmfQ family protein [Escherichia coli]
MDTLQDDYTKLLYGLMPPGPAWSDTDGVLDGLAPSLVRVHQRADELVIEIDPGQSTELIERYEELYGLPDSCSPAGTQTLRQRQQRLEAKANVAGGINEQFFLEQLEALGYTGVTIEQFQHLDASPDPEWGDRWRYFWRVTLPVDACAQWQTCTDACNTPIRSWGDTAAECVINKLCPSHTVVLFAYPDESGEGQQTSHPLTINSAGFQAGHRMAEPLVINQAGMHFVVVPALAGKPLTINQMKLYAACPTAEPLTLSRAQLHSGQPSTDPMTMNSAQMQTGYRTRSPVPVNSMQLQTVSRTSEPLMINHPGLHFAVVMSE